MQRRDIWLATEVQQDNSNPCNSKVEVGSVVVEDMGVERGVVVGLGGRTQGARVV